MERALSDAAEARAAQQRAKEGALEAQLSESRREAEAFRRTWLVRSCHAAATSLPVRCKIIDAFRPKCNPHSEVTTAPRSYG